MILRQINSETNKPDKVLLTVLPEPNKKKKRTKTPKQVLCDHPGALVYNGSNRRKLRLEDGEVFKAQKMKNITDLRQFHCSAIS